MIPTVSRSPVALPTAIVLLALIVGTATYSASAQVNIERSGQVTAFAAQAAAQLAEELDLTRTQSSLVESSLASGPLPVVLWGLAADLQPTLSPGQKDVLFSSPRSVNRSDRADVGTLVEEDSMRHRRERRQRADRGERAERRERANREDRADRADRGDRAERRNRGERDRQRSGEYRQEERAARDAALGLTEDQSSRLDQVLSAENAGLTTSRGVSLSEVPSEAADVLTPLQMEIVRVHHGLRMRIDGTGASGQEISRPARTDRTRVRQGH